jgi:hypothetical protein
MRTIGKKETKLIEMVTDRPYSWPDLVQKQVAIGFYMTASDPMSLVASTEM